MSVFDTSIDIWILVLALAVGTYLLRLSFFLLVGHLESIPGPVEAALSFIPPAVIAALVFPALLYVDGHVTVTLSNHELLAGFVAGFTAWRTESMLTTILVGMGTLWLLSVILA